MIGYARRHRRGNSHCRLRTSGLNILKWRSARPFPSAALGTGETGSVGTLLRESGPGNRVAEERACPEPVEGRSDRLEVRGAPVIVRAVRVAD